MTDGQWHEEERLSTPGRRSGFKLRRLRIDQETFGRFAEFIARAIVVLVDTVGQQREYIARRKRERARRA